MCWGPGAEEKLSPTLRAIPEAGTSSEATEAKGGMPLARESSTADSLHQEGQLHLKKLKKERKKKALSQHAVKCDTLLEKSLNSSGVSSSHSRGERLGPAHVTFFPQATRARRACVIFPCVNQGRQP